MKNKEKIQILEHRLNIHSELLERIISKLEFDNEPQLKQLDQSIFNGLSSEFQYASVDDDGHVFAFDVKPELMSYEWDVPCHSKCQFIDKGYDTSNWKESLIKRETNELTGSELCKAMLDRGDKYVLCLCWDSSYADIEQVVDIVSGFAFKQDKKAFVGVSHNWDYATPINNQGGPLTASDVDL